jgi:hypothetical protein
MRTMKTFVRKLYFLPALVLFLSVVAGGAAYAQITPLGDAFTNNADPTTNYGATTLLDVDGATQITYIQFNLASIPTTASVSQATLKLYVNAVTTTGSFNVDYVNGTWAESTIDGSNAPALGKTIASDVAITTADKNQYILINVTPAVQAWLDGSETNNGIALVANSTFNASFDSKENATTSHPAELDIAFAGGDGTITGVTTASGSGLSGGGTSGTLDLSLTNACATNQVLHWNGSAWACASAGTGTITGVTAGTDLTGGGTSGKVTLNLNTAALNSAYAQLGVANTFAPQQVIKGNGGNAIIGDPGCGSGFSGIGLTSSTLSGCSNYTMIGKSSGDVYVNSTSTGYIHFRNGNSGSNTYNDLATIDNFGNVTVAGNLTIAGQENLNYKELINANSNYQALDVTQSGGTGDGIDATTSSTTGYGVKGTSQNVGVYGVYSVASETGTGSGQAGVWGDAGATVGETLGGGVLGTADDNYAGDFANNSPGPIPTVYAFNQSLAVGSLVFETLGIAGGCTIDISGNLTCNGKITGVAAADGGARKVSLYAMQSPENWFEDFGSGVLTNGAMTVPLDPTFASTVNTAIDYHVFLTPNGDCKGLYVSQKTPTSFEVRELNGGTSSIAFDYRIVAKRAGYENQRLEDVTERFKKMREQEEKRRERMQQLRAARAVSSLPVPPATRAIAPIASAGSAAGPIPLPW